MTTQFFLPGAGGSETFWRPVADKLKSMHPQRLFSWPGLGDEPSVANVQNIDDLVAIVVGALHDPSDLIAQSLGGLVAVRAALAVPQHIRRLILTATSGGVPIEDLGGSDWRPEYREAFPGAAPWIMEVKQDLSRQIPSISVPTLLIWGDADPISPVAVGERLRDLLPQARLHVVKGGSHDLAQTHATEVAAIISEHLR